MMWYEGITLWEKKRGRGGGGGRGKERGGGGGGGEEEEEEEEGEEEEEEIGRCLKSIAHLKRKTSHFSRSPQALRDFNHDVD